MNIQQAIGDKKGSTVCEKQNVLHSISKTKASPLIQKLIEEKPLSVVGAYYHTRSGKVELL